MENENKDFKRFSELLEKLFNEIQEVKKIVNQKTIVQTEEYIDISTVCRIFKISKDTLRRYRKQGFIPFYKLKGKIYFLESEVRKALKNHYYGS